LSEPVPGLDEDRYEGRPLLRILDCYVLAVTGYLAPEMEAKVASIVRRQFGGGADWKATLRQTVKLPDDMDERIKALWRAQPAGTNPLVFTLEVSNANFVDMIDRL
jgi:hypothetical protein